MQLLAQEEYGLRCLLELARHGAIARTIHEVAAAEGLSPDYAAKLLRELRRGGLVASTRGAAGGYRLAREPGAITAWDAIAVLGGALFPEGFCECHPGRADRCVRSRDCALRAIWRAADDAVRAVLSRVTLADLVASEASMCARLGITPFSSSERRPS
jgi:Rrf2 family transcriptional regulator, iron-sulfur cluster assembly transcription factor